VVCSAGLVRKFNRTFAQAIQYTNSFTYNGLGDWRIADVGEFLNAVGYNDYTNAFGGVYCPMVDPNIRNYGGDYGMVHLLKTISMCLARLMEEQ
jgi:hypothetical protein